MRRIRALLLACVWIGAACGGGKGSTTAGTESDASSGSSGPGETATTAGTTGGVSTGGSTGGGGGPAKRCESRCGGDGDCLYKGGDIGFRCIGGVCVFPACASDDACVAELSGWTGSCAGPDDCGAAQACVVVDGAGVCANTTDALSCADFGLAGISWPTLGGGTAMVCGNPDARCEAGECLDPCKVDDECAPVMGHPTCEPMSGSCVCTQDLDCLSSGLPGFVTCIEGRCGCRKDADCAGGSNVDTCYAGVCGCSSDATCTAQIFDGATLACE